MNDRNPLLIPEVTPKKPCCPKCGGEKFSGRKPFGEAMMWTCSDCKNQWQGGMPSVPYDPSKPPPMPDRNPPPLEFSPVRDQKGNMIDVEEIRRPVSLVPEFRKGAPIPDGEE